MSAADLSTLQEIADDPRLAVPFNYAHGPTIAEVLRAALDRIETELGEWKTPFFGDGIAWHEELPSPYTYKASDFGALVAAVHAYESRALAAEAKLVVDAYRLLAAEAALRAAEAERDRWRAVACNVKDGTAAAEAEVTRLREALGEMHHLIQTRRTGIHMDGTEMFAQPLLAQLNSIARAALITAPDDIRRKA